MTHPAGHLLADPIGSLFDLGALGGRPDAELLGRYLAGPGADAAAAFEVLVRRHGPIVRGACLLVLRDRDEADDAFQATFLVLARRAGSIRRPEVLASWLLGVAHRVAVRLRRQEARRGAIDRHAVRATADRGGPDVEQAEATAAVREEVARLPPRFRSPVLLCYLEGMSYEEAARALGVTPGAIRGRLARARQRLRDRLTRRGLAPDDALPLLITSQGGGPAIPPPPIDATVRAATSTAWGQAIGAGPGSGLPTTLSEGVVRAMRHSRIKAITLPALAALAAVGLGAFVSGGNDPAATPATGPAPSTTTTTAATAGDRDRLQGTWVRVATESGGVSRLVAGEQQTRLTVRGASFRFRPGQPGEEATLDPTRSPKTIELTPTGDQAGPMKGVAYRGLYEVVDDMLMLCLDISGRSEFPREFAARRGDHLVIDVYRRTGP